MPYVADWRRMVAGLAMGSALCAGLGTAVPVLAQPLVAGVHEPFVGHDLVFGPGGQRVLPADATPVVERMFARPLADCTAGDISVQPSHIAGTLNCPGGPLAFRLTVSSQRVQVAADQPQSFVLEPPAGACDARCTERRAALVAAVRAEEQALPWARVLPTPDAKGAAPAPEWLTALVAAQQALAKRDVVAAKQAVQEAVGATAVATLTPEALLDLALLAAETGEVVIAKAAEHALTAKTRAAATDPAGKGLQLAAMGLSGDVTAAVDQALPALATTDAVPLLRVLVARSHYPQAARLLDTGLLRSNAPPRALLKLRFGLAVLMHDPDAQMAAGEALRKLDPNASDAAFLLSEAYVSKRQFRAAIELLQEQAKKQPKAPIAFGELHSLVRMFADAASREPEQATALRELQAQLRKAAASPKDPVARYVVALQAYQAGDFAEATVLLEGLMQAGQRHARLALPAALAWHWVGKTANAERLLAQAVALAPDDPEVYFARSIVVRDANPAQAIADLERFVQLSARVGGGIPLQQVQRGKVALAMLRAGSQPPAWDKPGPGAVAFLPHEHTAVLMADQPTAVDAPGDASAADAAAAATPPDADGPALVAAAAPAAQPAPPAEAEPASEAPRRWFPAVLLAVLASVMGLRLWLGPKRNGSANKSNDPPA